MAICAAICGLSYLRAIASSPLRRVVSSSTLRIPAAARAEAWALLAATSCASSRQSKEMERCHSSNSVLSGSRNRPDHIFADCCSLNIAWWNLALIFFVWAVQFGHFAAFAEGEQASGGVGEQLVAGVGDVEIAHGELADAIAWGEGGFRLFHAEALGMEGKVGRLCVQDGVVVAAAQLEGDFASDGLCDPALGGFAKHDGLGVEPATLVEEAAKLASVFAVLLDGVFIVNASDEALVGDEEQRKAGCLVDAA
uniref:Uncharacterized protein n=1 Tax=mine drainage metagenome TaxID=410659 RepID=E6PZX3_9ZZZZ